MECHGELVEHCISNVDIRIGRYKYIPIIFRWVGIGTLAMNDYMIGLMRNYTLENHIKLG